MSRKRLENFIEIIRESFDDSIKVYTQGSCVRFALALKEVFPQGNVMYNSDHAVFEYKGRFYDITGEVEDNELNFYIEAEKHYDMDKLKTFRYEGTRDGR